MSPQQPPPPVMAPPVVRYTQSRRIQDYFLGDSLIGMFVNTALFPTGNCH